MNPRDLELIHRYLDAEITESEFQELESALARSPELRQELVQATLLDEKLTHAMAKSMADPLAADVQLANAETPKEKRHRFSWSPTVAFLATSALILASFFLISNRNPLNASQELNRMIKSLANGDRVFRIDVEQVVLPNKKQLEKYDNTRPPKPSLEGAKLYLRGSDQFVLIRFRENGLPFITGSDGQIGWAIAPNDSVRTSPDPQEFNRDLPGHEHSIPLANLTQGLAQIQKAYSIQIIQSPSSNQQEMQEAMLIATKKPGERGPKRIEIQYDWHSGRITQIRFIEMPYGPERLTVRLTLMDELSLPENYFNHTHHVLPAPYFPEGVNSNQ